MLDRGRHALCERAPMVSSVTSHSTLTVASTGQREQDHTGRSRVRCKGSSNRRKDTRTRSATSLSSTIGPHRGAEQYLSCAVPLSLGFQVCCSNSGSTSVCGAHTLSGTMRARLNLVMLRMLDNRRRCKALAGL